MTNAIIDWEEENPQIGWPENVLHGAEKFREVAGILAIAGCIDGTHVLIEPSSENEWMFLNRYYL